MAQATNWAKQYQLVRPSEDVFIVAKSGKMALANGKGLLLTKLVYDTIYNFREGIAIVGKGRREVNSFGKVLSDFKYGYLTKAGQLIVDTRYDHIDAFSEGLGLLEIINSEEAYDNRTGYVFVNKIGQVVINHKPAYSCLPFLGNTAYVEVPHQGFWLPPYADGRDNGGHTQLYDVNGHTIYGNYLDRQGHLLIPRKYDFIAPHIAGTLRAVRKNNKWGFLDSLARLQVALQYDDIDLDSTHFWKDKRRVGINQKFGFINPHTGKLLTSLQYDDSKPSRSDLVWVRSGRQWGCLDEAGALLIPFKFSNVQPFARQVALVQEGKRWGTIDQKGKLLAPTRYDTIYPYQENRAAFGLANKFGFLDLTGREITPARYSRLSSFEAGHAYATLYGLFITLDTDGHWTSVKLQSGTLTTIAWVIIVLTGSLLWWRRRLTIIRNSTT